MANHDHKLLDLLTALKDTEIKRRNALRAEGTMQMEYPSSNASYLTTLSVIHGRALDRMLVPLSIVMVHAIVYTAIVQVRYDDGWKNIGTSSVSWEIFFSFVLNSTLSLLLVFRLNRAAERFWIARQYWGDIVAYSRSIVNGLLMQHSRNPVPVETAICNLAVWALATKDLLRRKNSSSSSSSLQQVNVHTYAGLLSESQVKELHMKYHHPPMVIAGRIRSALYQCFPTTSDNGEISLANVIRLDRLEEQLNRMIWVGGGLERIKNTPLPMVYVSHLRTFLLINLLLFPWVFGQGWSTIPIVAVSSYAWLGIEGAAAEVEAPFSQHRVNALNMNGYVIHIIQIIQEQLQCHTDEPGDGDIASTTVAL